VNEQESALLGVLLNPGPAAAGTADDVPFPWNVLPGGCLCEVFQDNHGELLSCLAVSASGKIARTFSFAKIRPEGPKRFIPDFAPSERG